MKKILTIAGSDCSGGAGIQADLKTFTAHKMYGMSILTALTAQNTQGVQAVSEQSPDFVSAQFDSIFTDIIPDAIKIGMVSSTAIIATIVTKLKEYDAKNIIVDPVMVSTSGSKLLNDEALKILTTQLIPLAKVITPNIPEAEILSGISITNKKDMEHAAQKIAHFFTGAILIKGGHLTDSADDLIYENGNALWLISPRIMTNNTHGTGCTLSSAIACNLALNCDIKNSIKNAKAYITGALHSNLNLGKGNGPINHCWNL
ncbi:MAG: bifunctional hydroxymethylpyrimidine kinase/phosphomethylpyrimidine kinase [Treponemataceae bacterium]